MCDNTDLQHSVLLPSLNFGVIPTKNHIPHLSWLLVVKMYPSLKMCYRLPYLFCFQPLDCLVYICSQCIWNLSQILISAQAWYFHSTSFFREMLSNCIYTSYYSAQQHQLDFLLIPPHTLLLLFADPMTGIFLQCDMSIQCHQEYIYFLQGLFKQFLLERWIHPLWYLLNELCSSASSSICSKKILKAQIPQHPSSENYP